MTFLNPLILVGLAAAAIPILLHIFNLRKLRTIEFSTLNFLKKLQRTKIRRLKIRQILLLVLRTLLIIFVVMAFARPSLRGSLAGGLGERARTTAMLLIDDSYSMTATDEHGGLLKQAKEAALEITRLLNEGDEAYLVKLSEAALQQQSAPMHNFSALRASIKEIKPSYIHRKMEDALRYSAKLIAQSKNFNKEIYLISDFQRGVVESRATLSAAQENLFPADTKIYLVPLGDRTPQNLGVESVEIPNIIFERGRPFTVKCRIANYSDRAARNHVVSVFLNGERVAQKGIDIPNGGFADAEFSVTPKSSGWMEGMVQLEDDDLEYDNRRYFTVNIPEKLKVLLVGNSNDLFYLKLALSARQSGNESALELREVRPDQLSASSVNSADVIILSNINQLNSLQIERLSSFMNAGGGLVIFPGQNIQPAAFNDAIANALKLPSIAGIEALGNQPSQQDVESYISLERVELAHPIFQGMFEETGSAVPGQQRSRPKAVQRSVESPKIQKFVRYTTTPQSLLIITLSNGVPFLIEQQSGKGRALLFSVAASTEWSDFPFKGLFVPLVYRSVSYLAQEQRKQTDVPVGEEIVMKSRSRSGDKWTILNPNKVQTVVTPTLRSTDVTIRFAGTDVPGIYSLSSGGAPIQKVAVNMEADESNTVKAEQQFVEKMLRRLGIPSQEIKRIERAQKIQQIVMESRFGIELWKHFLIAALLVALVEMFVARDSKRDLTNFSPPGD